MSPTSIVLCMAACFVGLVAALIVVNRFGSMSTRKLVVIAMMVAVYVVLNTVGTIRLGWINISVSALPIIVGALLYGPGGGLMVGLVGAFLGQLMTYGVTATTVLWIIPPAVRGLLIGLYAKRCGYELSRKQLVGVLIVTSLVVTLLNTGAIYLDSVIYGYYTYAYVFGKVGIRIACEEEPKFDFYTSRLGIRYNDIVDFYKAKLRNSKKFQLKMLHFFINTGIKDTAYYWNELSKCMNVYCELKAICPELDSLNIGGGFPIKNSLNFEYDYEYLTEEIVAQIKNICQRNGVEEPNIFTEFGSFTVGESGAVLYSIVNQKQQNDRENWYMIDSSFITTLPDTWGINQRYIMLAINNWDKEYQRVLLGGLTCDSEDFYNSESHINAIFLPKLEPGNPQYIGFFHTGAYQESIGGFGGIQHCLIPAPKHVIIDRDKDDNEYYTRLFAKEQSYRSMLRILGY